MVRQLLEAQASGRSAGISVIGNQIAAPDFDRIHAYPHRRQVNKALRYGAGDRMTDRAVLAHHVLVLEHHARAGTIILGDIRAADQINDLIGLDRAGPRIHRVRPDASEVVDLERRDGAVVLDADLSLAAM